MGGRIGFKNVDADNLIIGPRSKISSIRREANSVDGSRMVTHRCKLFRLARVLGICRIIDGLGRPYPDVSIYIKTIVSEIASAFFVHE